MLLFVYTTTRQRLTFVIFTCRYFRLSWNTTALSQSNCRNFSCSSIIKVIQIQDSTCGLRIPGSGFRILFQENVDSRFQSLAEFRIPVSEALDSGIWNIFHGTSVSPVECASHAALKRKYATILCKINDNLLSFVNETRFKWRLFEGKDKAKQKTILHVCPKNRLITLLKRSCITFRPP